jgi:hypothetical protein
MDTMPEIPPAPEATREPAVDVPKPRIAMWVRDAVGVGFFVIVWIVSARSAAEDAIRTGEPARVSLAIPVVLVCYVAYRLIRRAVKGSAYPAPKPGKRKSFRLS